MIFKKISNKFLMRQIVRKSIQCLTLGFLGSAMNIDFNHSMGNFPALYIL